MQSEIATRDERIAALSKQDPTIVRREYEGKVSQLQQMVYEMQSRSERLQNSLSEKSTQLQSVVNR